MNPRIYISGMYSGPSPSAGLGIARCLREGFKDLEIIGVDHWNGSSGLHHSVLSERLVLPPWNELDLKLYASQVRDKLDSGAMWISAHDIEVAFLAKNLEPTPLLLGPAEAALNLTVKPNIKVKELLPFAIPAQISLTENDSTLYSFFREHSWRIWIKGPYHTAIPVTHWKEFEIVRRSMMKDWNPESLVAQAHIKGIEESICFAGFNGELVDIVRMQKRVSTAEGKTWSGHISEVSPKLRTQISEVVKRIGWHGGAEIELICDLEGGEWINEWNPRFPAWIYGSEIAGRNLPVSLVERTLGVSAIKHCSRASNEFTRVVTEISVSPEYPLPLPKEPISLVSYGKYGANLTSLAEELRAKDNVASSKKPEPLSELMLTDLMSLDRHACETPERVLLPNVLKDGFSSLRHKLANVPHSTPCLTPAYSLKTAPDDAYLSFAKAEGFLAECISQLEVKRALRSGFDPSSIILNGPGKWWPQHLKCPKGLRAIFCDSVEELERIASTPDLAQTVGLRVRVPSIASRFGIGIGDLQVLERVGILLANIPKDTKIGIHFHMASSGIGISRWFDAFESVLEWIPAIEAASSREVSTLDLGGGWLLPDLIQIDFASVQTTIRQKLPGIKTVYFEPGKAMTQETMALRTKVLDVHMTGGEISEIVVDACIADLPLAQNYPHRIVFRDREGNLQNLCYGDGKVLGRICMEDDFISQNINLPQDIQIGDELIILDSGAYERSMSYGFGRGGY